MYNASMDEAYFRRAIAVARTGRGMTEPNPSVGCVLVQNGQVIGEGRSQHAGGKHAEPTAIAEALANGHATQGSTAYVTLEPCCHTNKRTPPCVPAVISAGIRRVVVGCLDPNPAVNGEGVRQLRQAGLQVDLVPAELEAEARQQIAPFTARTVHHRPYVTLKWAESAEGLIAGPNGQRRQISSEPSMKLVHGLRNRCEAILVGGETIRRDNPRLTVRGIDNANRPLRVIVTQSGDLPPDAHSLGENAVVYRLGPDFPTLAAVLQDLAKREPRISHVLVESGGRLARALAADNLADRAWIFRSPTPLGTPGVLAISLPQWQPAARKQIGPDALVELLNPGSPVYFATVMSADFEQLAR